MSKAWNSNESSKEKNRSPQPAGKTSSVINFGLLDIANPKEYENVANRDKLILLVG